MKVFILWLECYWIWVIKKISALPKFHLYKKTLKFLAFICIKVESKLFQVVFKGLFNMNLSLFLAYYQLSPWGALRLPWPLTTVYSPFLGFFSSSFPSWDCPLSSSPLESMPMITGQSQWLPPFKCQDRSSHWDLSFPNTCYISLAKRHAVGFILNYWNKYLFILLG